MMDIAEAMGFDCEDERIRCSYKQTNCICGGNETYGCLSELATSH